MSRIGKTAKTLAKILVPFGHTIAFRFDKNAPKPHSYPSDPMEAYEDHLFRVNITATFILDAVELAPLAAIGYYLLK